VENERNNSGVLEAYDNRQVKQVLQGLTEVGILAYTKPKKGGYLPCTSQAAVPQKF
jgi:hypothetical protein